MRSTRPSTCSALCLLAAAAAVTTFFIPTADARLLKDPKTTVTKGQNNNHNQKRQLSQRQLQEMMGRRKESASQLPPAVRTSIQSLAELGNMLRDNEGSALDERGLFETHKYFPECIRLSVDQCEDLIEQEIGENPDLFPGGVVFDVRSKRQITDDTYNYVVLVTNDTGEHVTGRLGDGVVEYPFLWRKDGVEVQIGPWDCDVGTPLTTWECCAFVKASVSGVDENGRELECYIQPPETPENSKLVIVVDPTTGTIVEDAIPHALSSSTQ